MVHVSSVRGRFRFCLFTCLALATTSAGAAVDQRSLTQLIHGEKVDQCPTPSAVANEVWQLTPADRRDVFERLTDVSVEDLGPSYRIIVTTRETTIERMYAGPDRDCARRARFVAIFIVLTLMPPEAPTAPTAQPEAVAERPAPTTAPPPPPPSPSVVRLELMANAHQGLGLGRASGMLAVGGRLQTLLGSGTFAPSFGLGYTPPVHFEVGPLQGKLSRATAAFGLRARGRLGLCQLGAQADAVAVFARATGTNLTRAASDSGLEVGAEIAASVAWPANNILQPFIVLEALWIPQPHSLIALPRGDAGTLPALWIGASMGIALAL